jgi:hypothetical protein
MDVIHCKALLESYRQVQEELAKKTVNQQQVNCQPINTYPLPFNAYSLDEEKTDVCMHFLLTFLLFMCLTD